MKCGTQQVEPILEDFAQEYVRRTPKSSALFDKANKVMPSGNARHTVFFKPRPFYVAKASGCKIVDVDGNELYDFVNNMGVLILGNNPPKVTEAAKTALEHGAGFGAPTELEIELAEMMCKAIPCAKKVRFTVSGTEATMTAIRAARALTGREKIAKFEGHYHGTHDYAQVGTRPTLDKAGPPHAPAAVPDSQGIPRAAVDSILVLPWNDLHACEALIKEHRNELAAVMLDPIANASGVIPPQGEFLKGLRECTEENDILLYFDEVVSGFRLAYGGAQEYYHVLPDIATYGKIIGGGFPVGALAGREDIMQLFGYTKVDEPKVRHLGTFNAHPVTMAAGIATLSELKPEVYEKINGYAQRIKAEIEALLLDMRIVGHVSAAGSFIYLIHFGIESMTNVRDAMRENKELAWQFAIGAICSGIYLTPVHSNNVSAAFSNEDITDAIAKMKQVIVRMGPHLNSVRAK
jgi:glutamate-1-semialdehyde 2,1-aminomutase